jgi:hypothetical protein
LQLFSSITSLCRGGRGGGYKELDEEELEEVRRRRKEAEEVWHILLYYSICVMVSISKSCSFCRMMEKFMMNLVILKRSSVLNHSKLKVHQLFLSLDVLDGK